MHEFPLIKLLAVNLSPSCVIKLLPEPFVIYIPLTEVSVIRFSEWNRTGRQGRPKKWSFGSGHSWIGTKWVYGPSRCRFLLISQIFRVCLCSGLLLSVSMECRQYCLCFWGKLVGHVKNRLGLDPNWSVACPNHICFPSHTWTGFTGVNIHTWNRCKRTSLPCPLEVVRWSLGLD